MPSLKGNLMIQRIQSVYLVLTAVLAAAVPVWLPLWEKDGVALFAYDHPWIKYIFIGVAILALLSLFRFKDRKQQFVLNRLNLLLNLILLGVFVYHSLNLSGETSVSEKGIGMLIPVFSIVLLVLANKAIKKDEDLVKSVDRLR